MPVTPDRPGPYSPLSTVMEVITRYRERGLPAPITKDVLARAGIAETLVPRVLQSLTALDLVAEDGQPTPVFDGIRRAPEAEYPQRLKEWLDGAYADVLNYVDPATATETDVRDAFRNYLPVGQQARMVSLFIGLYAAAGIGQERPTAPKPRVAGRGPRAAAAAKIRERNSQKSSKNKHATNLAGPIPAPLSGLLTRLPAPDRGWTQERRDKFIATFGTVLDFCFPIVEIDDDDDNDVEEADAA